MLLGVLMALGMFALWDSQPAPTPPEDLGSSAADQDALRERRAPIGTPQPGTPSRGSRIQTPAASGEVAFRWYPTGDPLGAVTLGFRRHGKESAAGRENRCPQASLGPGGRVALPAGRWSVEPSDLAAFCRPDPFEVAPGATTVVTVHPWANLKIQVRDRTGSGVPDATVLWDSPVPGRGLQETTTDQEGVAVLRRLPLSGGVLRVRADGFAYREVELAVGPPLDENRIQVVLDPAPGADRGLRFLDRNSSEPVGNARVTLPAFGWSKPSRSDGRVSLPDWAVGPLYLEVDADEYAPASIWYTENGIETVELCPVKPVRVAVLAPDGAPAAGAEVLVEDLDLEGADPDFLRIRSAGQEVAVTDEEGHTSVPLPSGASCVLLARHASGTGALRIPKTPLLPEDLVVPLQAAAPLRLILRFPGGEVPGQVQVRGLGWGEDEQVPSSRDHLTCWVFPDANALREVQVHVPGWAPLRLVRAPDYRDRACGWSPEGRAALSGDLELVMRPAFAVNGRLSTLEGRPWDSCRLRFLLNSSQAFSSSLEAWPAGKGTGRTSLPGWSIAFGEGTFETTTGKDGAFRIEGLPVGNYEVLPGVFGQSVARRPIGFLPSRAYLEVPSAGFVELRLPAPVQLSLTVRDRRSGVPVSAVRVSLADFLAPQEGTQLGTESEGGYWQGWVWEHEIRNLLLGAPGYEPVELGWLHLDGGRRIEAEVFLDPARPMRIQFHGEAAPLLAGHRLHVGSLRTVDSLGSQIAVWNGSLTVGADSTAWLAPAIPGEILFLSVEDGLQELLALRPRQIRWEGGQTARIEVLRRIPGGKEQ